MNQWFKQLSQKEQRLLVIGGVLVGLALIWRFLMVPLTAELDARLAASQALQQQLADMQQMNLSDQGVSRAQVPLPAGMTFSSWVDQQMSQHGLQETVNRTEPQDENTLTVWLVNVSFDQVVDWLQQISRQHGIQVDQFDVSVTDQALGLTNIRMRMVK
jgi:general secretion pathway protein M